MGIMSQDQLPGIEKLPGIDGANVYGASTSTVDPALRTVDAPKETVQGQLVGMLSKESPILTNARTNAAQVANARGLMNSSIAAGAGEKAVIETATPIAAADAATYTGASRDNQTAQNTASTFNAGSKNTAALTAAGAANTSSNIAQSATEQRATQAQAATNEQALFAKQAAQQTAMQQLQGQQQVTLQQMQSASAKDLANIEAQYKTVMQTSATAGQIMAAAQAGVNEIMKDATMTNDAKAALIGKLYDGLKANLGVIGAMGNLDLSKLLVFPGATPAAGNTTAPPPPPANPPANSPAAPASPAWGTAPALAPRVYDPYNPINSAGGTMGR